MPRTPPPRETQMSKLSWPRAGALVIALIAALIAAGPASADTTIDTTPSWAAGEQANSFGKPNTSTYGQVVTAPAGENQLTSFTFFMQLPTSVTFRGAVYAWDLATNRATGPSLYESAPRQTTDDTVFQEITFNTGGIAVTPGQQYVLFASVSKDFEGQPDGSGPWGHTVEDSYAGGRFVFLNNQTDESQWTSTAWTILSNQDLAFRATFGVAPTTAPLPPAATAPTPAAAPTPVVTVRPLVRVAGVRRACVADNFRVRVGVASAALELATVSLDGRRIGKSKRPSFSVVVPARRLRAGGHRLRIAAVDTAGNRRTVRRRFTRCARKAQVRRPVRRQPRFTG